MSTSLAASFQHLQMDPAMMMMMEDMTDASTVLPMPATHEQMGYVPTEPIFAHHNSFGDAAMMVGLDEIISPYDAADEQSLFGRLAREDTLSASEDGSSEFGETLSGPADDVFAVEFGDPADRALSSSLGDSAAAAASAAAPLRMAKPRSTADRRFAPFPVAAPAGAAAAAAATATGYSSPYAYGHSHAATAASLGGVFGLGAAATAIPLSSSLPLSAASSGVSSSVASPARPRPPKAMAPALKLSSSLPGSGLVLPSSDGKRCACCGCSNTPMWRDGRDGQRLCNACGIRWQKYGVCCANCHYVPRKLENNSGACKRCHAPLPPPVTTRRRTSSTSSTSSKPS